MEDFYNKSARIEGKSPSGIKRITMIRTGFEEQQIKETTDKAEKREIWDFVVRLYPLLPIRYHHHHYDDDDNDGTNDIKN